MTVNLTRSRIIRQALGMSGGGDKDLGVSGGGDKALSVSGGGDKALGVFWVETDSGCAWGQGYVDEINSG